MLRRFDHERGFLITRDGMPFQAMYRDLWRVEHFTLGMHNGIYWLSPALMPEDMAAFVYTAFANEILTEFIRTR